MKATAPKTRIGIIGVGRMGEYHLRKILALASVETVGFFEANAQRAAKLSTDYGCTAFTSIEDLLFECDAVIIASPTELHFAHVHAALEQGVHVLVEKPMASTVAEAEKLVELARARQLVLQVGMVERYRLAKLAQSIPLGRIRFLETHRLTPQLPRDKDIDVVSDLMIHDLDLALSLAHMDPVHISAVGMRVLTGNPDVANVRLEFPDGAVMNLNASRVSGEPLRRLRVFAENAYASFDFQLNTATWASGGVGQAIEKHAVEQRQVDPLLEQAEHFEHCVRSGQPPLVSGVDGLRALRIAEQVLAKIRERESLAQTTARSPHPVLEGP